MYVDMPADRRQYWLNILGVEGEVAGLYAEEGVDEVVFVDDMYGTNDEDDD